MARFGKRFGLGWGDVSSFNPKKIPGLGLDLDASYGVLNSINPDVPATNGQAVRRWLDKSGNGRDFDQSTATNQPIFESAGMNGRACIDCDGVNDFMERINDSLLQNVPGATVFHVIINDSVSPTNLSNIFAISRNANFSRYVTFQNTVGARYSLLVRRTDEGVSGQIDSTVSSATTNPTILTSLADFPSATGAIYIDGVLNTAGATANPGALTSNTASILLRLAANPASPPTIFYGGKIARVLVWPRALTAPEIAQVHAYLSQTYGIPLA